MIEVTGNESIEELRNSVENFRSSVENSHKNCREAVGHIVDINDNIPQNYEANKEKSNELMDIYYGYIEVLENIKRLENCNDKIADLRGRVKTRESVERFEKLVASQSPLEFASGALS